MQELLYLVALYQEELERLFLLVVVLFQEVQELPYLVVLYLEEQEHLYPGELERLFLEVL